MDVSVKEIMPSEASDRLALLDGIMRNGIERLLQESRKKGFLKPPYGKNPEPSPLITEDDFIRSISAGGDTKEDLDEPSFSYQYGFNPLVFLADYFLWSHPDSFQDRLNSRNKAFDRLKFRAKHADVQINTMKSISETSRMQRSGILWGPIVAPFTHTSVICVFGTAAAGIATIQLSRTDDFTEIVRIIEVNVAEELCHVPSKCLIDNLNAGSKYFIRVCLSDHGLPGGLVQRELTEEVNAVETPTTEANVPSTDIPYKFGGIMDGYYQSREFYTLLDTTPVEDGLTSVAPSQSGSRSKLNSKEQLKPPEKYLALIVLGGPVSSSASELTSFHRLQQCKDLLSIESLRSQGALSPTAVVTACVLGDLFAGGEYVPAADIDEFYKQKLWEFYSTEALWSSNSILRQSAMILAWQDRCAGSDQSLREEEAALKQFSHDTRRYMKKFGDELKKAATGRRSPTATAIPTAPTLRRPPMTAALENLLKGLPLELEADKPDSPGVRRLYRSVSLSTNVEAYVLDMRGGYLGRQQAKWLRSQLESSTATWKLILTGQPCGLVKAAQSFGGQSKPQSRASLTPETSILGSDPFPPPFDGDGAAAGGGKSERPAGGRVQMTLPPAQDLDECDELGRPKSSLSYVVASMQRRADAVANGSISESVGEGDPDAGETVEDTQTSASSAGESVNSLEEDLRLEYIEQQRTEDTIVLGIESGVVILSCGPLLPFATTYDPSGWGKSYALEVGVGSAFVSGTTLPASLASEEQNVADSAASMTVAWQLSYSLGATVLLGDEASGFSATAAGKIDPDDASVCASASVGTISTTSVCVVQEEDRETLRIKLLSSPQASVTPTVLFDALLYTSN